jgi:DNA repair protein RadC
MSHPREVFRAAVIGAAFAVVMMHNHPSGDPTPSQADRQITKTLVESGRILRIHVSDHIIVGHNRHCSFREAGLI